MTTRRNIEKRRPGLGRIHNRGCPYGPNDLLAKADRPNFGPAARKRWRTCVHEAGHGVAFSLYCGVQVTLHVYRTSTGSRIGGMCRHGSTVLWMTDAFATSAADAAVAILFGHFWPPPARPKRSCGPRITRKKHSGKPKSDRQLLLDLANGDETVLADRCKRLESVIEQFVSQNHEAILRVARELFVNGRVLIARQVRDVTAIDSPLARECELAKYFTKAQA